ncbi:MAG: PKD domain-containing protein [Bacteroidales bacterium]|nr:PKD domain-containing protein [Bacteroidales bacterium]
MKKIVLFVLCVAALLASASVYSQNQPVSFKKSELLSEIDNVTVAPPDMVQIMNEDASDEKNGEMYKVSRIIDVNMSMDNCGTTDILADGTKVWRVRIACEGATALKVMCKEFYIPNGAELYLYNENRQHVVRVDANDNPKFGTYYSPNMIQGDALYMEYVQPASVSGNPVIKIDGLCYFYRGVDAFVGYYAQKRETSFGSSESCEVNINCAVGANWQDQKKGVAVIFVVVGNSGGFCTGTLVNNTANDGTPYFLTADHCGGVDGANYFGRWEFYFNFEATGCSNPTSAPQYQTVVGSTRRARPTGAEASGTDFLLLELSTTEDELETIGAYYNGWDRSSTGAQSGAGIHHPSGDIKKISFYIQQLTAGTYNNDAPNGHWLTMWQNNNSDITGVTEPGSSGSPLFGANKLVVGTLTGGSSNCSATGNRRSDYYGRFDLHWDNAGPNDANRLKPWLDPQNTGAETCQGRYPNSGTNPPTPGTLTADFTANPTTVAVGGTVAFRDASTGNPTSWSWSFPGGNPSTSTSQNPSVVYSTAGTYNVSLTVSDGNNEDSETKTAYITVNENGDVPPPDPNGELAAAFVASSYNIVIGDCINFTDRSSGSPTSWTWTFQGAETVSSTQQNPTNICYNTPGAYNVTLYVQNANGDYDSEVCEGCIIVENNPTLPIADFEASITVIPVGGVVRYTNLSQNGPFDQWAWHFEGGTPENCSDSVPPVIAYNEVGTYDVELRCRKTNGVQDIELKRDYIRVVPHSDMAPTANFTSNKTLVRPGETVNFVDLSTANPYRWTWEFEGGEPATSIQPNPSVVYSTPGSYNVKLTVMNNIGTDEITKEMYIVVSDTDPCNNPPQADFSATNRLAAYGDVIMFENLSTNNPAFSQWTFEGGSPRTSTEFSPLNGVTYSTPGIYSVTLTVSNSCGSTSITKENYIRVYNGHVASYCDTLSNISTGDVLGSKSVSGTWGFYAGHNGKKIKAYADYFNTYTFSNVRGLLVPVNQSVYGDVNARVTFCVWDDNNGMPGEELGNKKMYIRDLVAGQTTLVRFDSPIEVPGPFHVGFKVTYTDSNNDEVSDDLFVVPVVTNRPYDGLNTMSVMKNSVWYSAPEFLSFNSSMPIEPVSCLENDIEEVEADNSIDVYPNPTSGLLNITFGNMQDVDGYDVQMFDALGRLVSSVRVNASGDYSMDISSYPEGLYIIRISTPTFVANKKIMLTK